MPHIQQLDRHVADLIAAGEVVERPASVVKELMENAIDAGAGTVTVEIESGGMTLIRVTDDGCGIAPDEVPTAFLRHATSKIRNEYDLEAIGTLGFRGEALAAIASVARIEILTRTGEASFGVALTLEGGVAGACEEVGCPLGTTMLVRNLFYNTPARLKFMKRDVAEGTAVLGVVQRLALSHPEVAVKFIREGKQELVTPGDGDLKATVYAVLGRDLALGFLPVRGGDDNVQVSGFVSLPTCCRGTRGYQHFFVNGRYVKSRTMMAALEEAYKNQKMVGKFPGCVLHVQVRPGSVDVNVHPTKTEVKFVSDKQVFDGVYYTVLSALGGSTPRPSVVMKAPAEDWVTPNQLVLKAGNEVPVRPVTTPPQGFRAVGPRDEGAAPATSAPPPAPSRPLWKSVAMETRPQPVEKFTAKSDALDPAPLASSPFSKKTDLPVENYVESLENSTQPQSVPEKQEAVTPAVEENSLPPVEPVAQTDQPFGEEEPWRVAGEVLRTYVIVEQGDKILLIDKHAAHERMNFDRLKAEDYDPMSQQLLTPLSISLSPEEKGALLGQTDLLEQYGFELEDFGGGSIMVNRIPFDLPQDKAEQTLGELAHRLLTTGSADPASARDELLHTMACKAAIKGGWKNAAQELEAVAGAVMSGRVKYCPHGRPVAIEMTRGQLEKQFKRA